MWAAREGRALPADMRGEICNVLGHEAAAHGIGRDGTTNRLGRELDELAGLVALDE